VISSKKVCSGFSLLEAVAALFVFSTAIAALYAGFAASMHAQQRAEAVTRARFYAEQKLAELKALELVPGGATEGGFPDRQDYFWTLTYSTTGVPSLYLARVDIIWYEKEGTERRSISVDTLQYYQSSELPKG
jgi:type II secretory pathway pseudopilin PulG